MSYMDMLGPEELAQVAVVNYLRLAYPWALFWHTPSEQHTKSTFQRWKRKVLGFKKGVPDLIIAEPCKFYFGLAIEMKHGKNKCTPDQHQFLLDLGERGWRTHVCYSSADAIDIIDDYLGKK